MTSSTRISTPRTRQKRSSICILLFIHILEPFLRTTRPILTYPGSRMVKLGALAFGLLTVVAQVSAQQTVKVMPFGASIVSVSSIARILSCLSFIDTHPEMLACKPPSQTPQRHSHKLRLRRYAKEYMRRDRRRPRSRRPPRFTSSRLRCEGQPHCLAGSEPP